MIRRRLIPKSFRFFYNICTRHTALGLIIACLMITAYFLSFPSSPNDDPRETLPLLQKRRVLPPITTTTTTTTSSTTTTTIGPEEFARYAFVDVQSLGVNIYDLDRTYQPSNETEIDYPPLDMHPLSNIVELKGDASLIVFNRVPHCYEHTVRRLLADVSILNSFKYLSSEIYTPFSYNVTASLSIARSLLDRTVGPLLYERHIYFFNFFDLQIPSHPVWLNVVQEPIRRVALEYQRTRQICRDTGRCFVDKSLQNLSLDECVLKRSPRECIAGASGVSRTLPFFCGMKDAPRCEEESDWALNQAKLNVQFYYSVVGLAEEFYKFLYVLEKIVPQFFKLARLIYMNQWDPKALYDERDVNVPSPSGKTVEILRPLLHFEYQLYEFIKERFLQQYNILVEMDN